MIAMNTGKKFTIGALLLVIGLAGFVIAKALVKGGSFTPVLGNILQQSSETTSSIISDRLNTLRQKLFLTADFAGSHFDCAALQPKFTELSSEVDMVSAIDLSGNVSCSSDQKLLHSSAISWDSYKNFFTDPSHYPTLSRISYIPGGEKGLIAYVPVLDNQKKFIGTIASETYLSTLGSRISTPNSLVKAGYIVAFDDNGDILFHFDKTLIGKNHFSDEIQNYTGHNAQLNNAFLQAAKGVITNQIVHYTVRGQNRLGEFRPFPVGQNHYLIVLTSLPDY